MIEEVDEIEKEIKGELLAGDRCDRESRGAGSGIEREREGEGE